jgi:hypothetical protein
MSRIPGQHDHDWSHVQRAPAQPAESVPVVLRSLPKAQSGEVPTLSGEKYGTLGILYDLRGYHA